MVAVGEAKVAGDDRQELTGGEAFGWSTGMALRGANGRTKGLGTLYAMR